MRRAFLPTFSLLLMVARVAAVLPNAPTSPRAYAHGGSQVDLTWTWFGFPPVTDFQIFRDGVSVGTTTTMAFSDTGLTPGVAHSYYVVARNSDGVSPGSRTEVATTQAAGFPFVLDGLPDFSRYMVESSGGCGCGDVADLGIYAARRGSTLYIATKTIPPGGQYDYFIVVSDEQGFFTNAPWAKSGQINVLPGKPFIGAESTNSFVGWFNAPVGSQVFRSANPDGVIEGTLDLVQAFGSVPESIYVVALAYETGDGGHVVAESPAGNKDDLVTGTEIRRLQTVALRDEDADGLVDLLDPLHGFHASIARGSNGSMTISVPAVPRDTYTFQTGTSPAGPWTYYTQGVGSDSSPTISFTDSSANQQPLRFYRIFGQDGY